MRARMARAAWWIHSPTCRAKAQAPTSTWWSRSASRPRAPHIGPAVDELGPSRVTVGKDTLKRTVPPGHRKRLHVDIPKLASGVEDCVVLAHRLADSSHQIARCAYFRLISWASCFLPRTPSSHI